MIPYDLRYAFPEAAYLSVVLFLFALLFWLLYRYREKALSDIWPKQLIPKVMVPRSNPAYWGKAVLLIFCWTSAVVALMGPEGDAHYPTLHLPGMESHAQPSLNEENRSILLRRKAHDIFFLVDASASMSVTDTRPGTSRLAYAKSIADEMASTLNGETAALYAFTSLPDELSPLTMDYLYVRLMLRDIAVNEGKLPGTNLVSTLADLRKRYFSAPTPVLKTLIILSDGGDTAIEWLQGQQRQRAIAALANLVSDADQLKLRVYTVGMGSREGKDIPGIQYDGKPVLSKVQEDILQSLARTGRGEYFYANDYTSVDIARAINASMRQDPPYYIEEKGALPPETLQDMLGKNEPIYNLYFQFPLAAAIILLTLMIYLPEAKKIEKEAEG